MLDDSIGIYPDGLAFPGYLAGVPRLHPACEFTFRPMLAEEVRALASAIGKQSPEDGQVTVAQYIGDRVATWSLQGPNGSRVAPSPESFRHINPELAEKISGVVQGYRPSDLKPTGEQTRSGVELLEASEKKLTTGLRLILDHPQMTRISCRECKLWSVNLKLGKFDLKNGRKIPRDGTPTPCRECPKESPENEPNCTLSPANNRILEMWHKYRACGWEGLPPACKGDAILVRQFALIDIVMRSYERRRSAQELANEILPFVVSKEK